MKCPYERLSWNSHCPCNSLYEPSGWSTFRVEMILGRDRDLLPFWPLWVELELASRRSPTGTPCLAICAAPFLWASASCRLRSSRSLESLFVPGTPPLAIASLASSLPTAFKASATSGLCLVMMPRTVSKSGKVMHDSMVSAARFPSSTP